MLINLSNHPSEHWGNKQLEAAGVYGSIVDLAFPAVDPTADTESLLTLARQQVERCKAALDASSDSPKVVHVMGEHNLTFLIIQLLMKQGIRVLASTTKRQVKEVNGTKQVVFNFEQFRDYQLIEDV